MSYLSYCFSYMITFRNLLLATGIGFLITLGVIMILGDLGAFAQVNTTSQQVQEVKQQVEATDNQVDAATVTAAGGAVVGGIAVLKQIFNQRLNTKRDKTTDKDTGKFFALISKFYQAKYMYPHMTDKEILDLPISNNPMSKMTLGQSITAEADLWNEGNQQYWNLPAIQMAVPTNTTIQAIKSKESYPTVVAITDDQKQEKKEETTASSTQETTQS